jgi:hypothetical protein
MSGKVNLDALIPREDFAVEGPDDSSSSLIQTIPVTQLERDNLVYGVLRKPDFQRETSEWSPDTICDFVGSFLAGDLIPAVILWRSRNGSLFVIDGSHRLSALIAWVQDDYGDGFRSKLFYEHQIPKEQIRVAENTRRLIKKNYGSYADHKMAVQNPTGAPPDLLKRATNLASLALQVQWVKGDADRAEASFFKINQQAAPINKTELRLLQSRRKPNAVAARAIVRSGTGHKYWSAFSSEVQTEVKTLASEIHQTLFTPELDTPIKTLDLPVAGKGYAAQSLPLIFDFVNLVNDVTEKTKVQDDTTGQLTIEYLKRCVRLVRRISGVHPSSLGLHPAIYFYGVNGRYQPSAFLAAVELVKQLENKNSFTKFTKVRREFEEFMLRHKDLINQITYKLGTRLKTATKTDAFRGGIPKLLYLYNFVIEKLLAGKTESDILAEMHKDKQLSFLQPRTPKPSEATPFEFNTDEKSTVFLREALNNLNRCKICNGAIHVNSITIDHITPKREGGSGIADNGQLAHPLCNSTIKG